MKVTHTPLPGLLVLEPKTFGDHRGYFFEGFNEKRYQEVGINCHFLQDNMSRSHAGVLRGLHFQTTKMQDKLVTVTHGVVFDVAVDIRLGSPTFGQWFGLILSDENHKQLFVPKGFAHGFYVLSPVADFHYKCSDYYAPEYEAGIIWNDPELDIKWPLDKDPVMSSKDQVFTRLSKFNPELLPSYQN